MNFIPRRMTPAALRQGLIDLARRVYEPGFVQARRERFFETLQRNGVRRNRGLVADDASAA
ncbi:MAG: DUF4070 domain-containing protein [Phycisphaerales bacterium]|nr:DUF4070 domain-containing protein [Phycisphaerales bacterium]